MRVIKIQRGSNNIAVSLGYALSAANNEAYTFHFHFFRIFLLQGLGTLD